jgi:hypothetical protein
MKNIFLLCTLILFCSNTHAAGVWVDISDIKLWSNTYTADTIRVETSEARMNPSNCSDPDSYMVLSTLSEPTQQRIYSSLLAAKMSNKIIRLRIDGCQSERPAIINVVLVN